MQLVCVTYRVVLPMANLEAVVESSNQAGPERSRTHDLALLSDVGTTREGNEDSLRPFGREP